MVTVMERLSEEKLKRPYVDPGIYQSHPDVEDRVNYLIETMRNMGGNFSGRSPCVSSAPGGAMRKDALHSFSTRR
jgi:hypothetical protein